MKLTSTSPGDLIHRTRPLVNAVATAEDLAYLNAGNPVQIVGHKGNLLFYRLGVNGEVVYIVRREEWDDGWWNYYQ